MANELRWFKFFPAEWIMGNISHENYATQGLFLTACCHYWHQKCDVNFKVFSKILGKNSVKKLINADLIKLKDEKICIEFLDEQYTELSEKHRVRVESGRKGGLSNAKAKLKQSSSIKDKEEDKDKEVIKKSIKERESLFRLEANTLQNEYDLNLINSFCDYWTESNANGKKMRFEMQKTFDLKRRLKTWSNNQNKFETNGTKQSTNKIGATRIPDGYNPDLF